MEKQTRRCVGKKVKRRYNQCISLVVFSLPTQQSLFTGQRKKSTHNANARNGVIVITIPQFPFSPSDTNQELLSYIIP